MELNVLHVRSSYNRHWAVMAPESILRRCIVNGLLSIDEATTEDGQWKPVIEQAAIEAAEDLNNSWPEDEGFGSSDFVGVAEGFLSRAGLATEYVDGRLTRSKA